MRANEKIYVGTYNGEERVARKLMPEECLRLMGFENFHIVVSDNNIYRQSGNSIAVPVLKAIFKEIKKYIKLEFENLIILDSNFAVNRNIIYIVHIHFQDIFRVLFAFLHQ